MPTGTSDLLDRRRCILFAHSGRNWIRGSEQCLLDLLKTLDPSRYTCAVLCDQPVLADAVASLGIPVRLIEDLVVGRTRSKRELAAEVRAFAREVSARIVHVNSSIAMPAMLRVSRDLRLPILAHIHIVPDALERRHLLLHQASVLVGVSRVAIRGFVEDGFPGSQLRVIYNGVDAARISTGDATGLRSQLGIPSTAVTIGATCSLIERKGIDTAIAVTAAVRAAGDDIHLIIAGDGEIRAALGAQAASLGIADYVHLIGERSDAGAIVRDAIDIVVSPSHDEAFPLTVLEAGFHRKPVVASDIAAHREGLLDGITGLIVPSRDVNAFSAAVSGLVRNPQLRQQMGASASARVRNEFSLDRYTAEFDKLYRELLGKPALFNGWLLSWRWPSAYTTWALSALRRRVTGASLR